MHYQQLCWIIALILLVLGYITKRSFQTFVENFTIGVHKLQLTIAILSDMHSACPSYTKATRYTTNLSPTLIADYSCSRLTTKPSCNTRILDSNLHILTSMQTISMHAYAIEHIYVDKYWMIFQAFMHMHTTQFSDLII